MEENVVEQFLGKHVVLYKRYVGDPNRATFKLYCKIQDVTEKTVVIFTDRLGAILLEDIVSIVESKPGRNRFG